MARPRKSSPTLQLTIGPEQYDRAVQSNSGGCLIADAIKAQYPDLTNVSVDMATIRATDRKRGERFTYLTPADAQQALLWFDQGWPNPVEQLTIKGAVQITPITRSRPSTERRAARRAALDAKLAAGGTLTPRESASYAKLTQPDRPTTTGRPTVSNEYGRTTVRGGRPRIQGRAHPNLLRGRNRHFGAKMADPGVAFRQAVEEAVAERLTAGSAS